MAVRDGRRLSFAEFGRPRGAAIVWMHGTPGARRQIPVEARMFAEAHDLRIIGVDRHGPALLGSIVLTAVTPALLLIAPTLPAAGAVVVITSAGFGVFDVAVASLRQRLSPQGLLGRVVAAYRTVLHGAGALGILAGGGMAAAHGLGAPLIMSAVIGIIACVLCTRGTWTVPVS